MTNETNSSKASGSGSKPKRLPSTVTLGHTSYQLKDSLKSVQAIRQKTKPTQANLAGHNVSLSQRFNGYRSTESSWNVRGLMATVFMVFTLSHGCLAQLIPQGPSMLIMHRFHQINPFPQPSMMANNLLTQPSIPPFQQPSGIFQNAVTPNPFGSYAVPIQQPTTPVVTPFQPSSGAVNVIHLKYNPFASTPVSPSPALRSTGDIIVDQALATGLGVDRLGLGLGMGMGMGSYPASNPWSKRMLRKRLRVLKSAWELGILPYNHPANSMFYYPPTDSHSPFYKLKHSKCKKCKECPQQENAEVEFCKAKGTKRVRKLMKRARKMMKKAKMMTEKAEGTIEKTEGTMKKAEGTMKKAEMMTKKAGMMTKKAEGTMKKAKKMMKKAKKMMKKAKKMMKRAKKRRKKSKSSGKKSQLSGKKSKARRRKLKARRRKLRARRRKLRARRRKSEKLKKAEAAQIDEVEKVEEPKKEEGSKKEEEAKKEEGSKKKEEAKKEEGSKKKEEAKKASVDDDDV